MTAAVGDRTARVEAAPRLRGRISVPSDKSIGHRSLIANALADGEAEVVLRHPGADLRSTVACLRRLGVRIEEEVMAPDEHRFVVRGGAWTSPTATLDCGNSGTTLRLLAGAIAGRGLPAVLDGDGSLRRRPMERIAAPLRAMGASVATREGRPPVRLGGGATLRPAAHRMPVASAQVVGAISLAALGAPGRTVIETPIPVRDHTERLLAWMGVPIERQGAQTVVHGPAGPESRGLRVPGDPSSAAAWLVAATLHPDADLELAGVALNPTRLAVIEVLTEMGARIEVLRRDETGPEPVGDLRARSAARLRPVRIDAGRVPALVDELPLLAVAMAAAHGPSELRGAGELRLKECDRIAATVAGLSAIGAAAEELPDGWRVGPGRPRPARIDVRGDHRIAIAFAVAALAGVAGPVEMDDPGCTSVSYPSFWTDLRLASGQAG